MANSLLLPYVGIANTHSPKRRHWRRHTTTIAKPCSSLTHFVHHSTSNLPDIVNDCQTRHAEAIAANPETKLTCKAIAHSLRLVADQVDKKYCQDADFHRQLHCLSLRIVFHSAHIRTILYTLWTRSFLPLIVLITKTKTSP